MGLRKKWKQTWKGASDSYRDLKDYIDPLFGKIPGTTDTMDAVGGKRDLNADGSVGGAVGDYNAALAAAATDEERAKIREEYEKRRKAKKTQTILTSGSGASGTPATSRPTLLGG